MRFARFDYHTRRNGEREKKAGHQQCHHSLRMSGTARIRVFWFPKKQVNTSKCSPDYVETTHTLSQDFGNSGSETFVVRSPSDPKPAIDHGKDVNLTTYPVRLDQGFWLFFFDNSRAMSCLWMGLWILPLYSGM